MGVASEQLVLISTLAFFGAAFLIFCGQQIVVGRSHTERVQKDGGSIFFAGTFLMEFGYWMFLPVGRLLIALKISPSTITLTCMVISFAAGVLFSQGEIFFGGLVWLFGSCMDALDGMVARMTDTSSNAGAVLDSVVDRIAELSVLAGLCVYYRESDFGLAISLLALAGSVLTSYISAKGEILGLKLPRGLMRRAERAVYIGVAAFAFPFLPELLMAVLSLIAVFSLGSSAFRLYWMYQHLQKKDRA